MGCLVEFFVEAVFELLGEAYFYIMRQVVPKHTFRPKTEKRLKTFATLFSVVLLLSVLAGLIMISTEEGEIVNIGKYVTFISLGLIAIQIILAIAVRINMRKK